MPLDHKPKRYGLKTEFFGSKKLNKFSQWCPNFDWQCKTTWQAKSNGYIESRNLTTDRHERERSGV